MTRELFHWTTVDARPLLPPTWQGDILAVADNYAQRKVLLSRHSTSREGRRDYALPTRSVDGQTLARTLPWLRALYEGAFRDLAQRLTSEPVSVMADVAFGCVLNIQSGPDRYECHIDSNPIEGLLYVTTHQEDSGGVLVVSNRLDAQSVEEVDADRAVIEPKAGHLVLFDARLHSHYVTPLSSAHDVRVAVAMNYYVPSCPESTRPPGLNSHLSNVAH